MAFLNVEFTRAIQFHRQGGSCFNTTVVTTSSGQEQRNANWSQPRAKYTVSVITPATSGGQPVDRQQFIDDLRTFFLNAKGKLNSFYYYDPIIQAQVPVRFDTDEFNVQIEPSAVGDGKPVITWNSLVLMEVLPPNF